VDHRPAPCAGGVGRGHGRRVAGKSEAILRAWMPTALTTAPGLRRPHPPRP